MCGIVGYISNTGASYKRDKLGFLINALTADSIRGYHSTGICSVDYKGKPTVFKEAQNGATFVQDKYFNNLAGQGMDPLVIGHNRWATLGAVTAENAHPFQKKHITGVHNGSLFDHETLIHEGAAFDVDSEAVINSIAEVGVDDTVKYMDGAYSIVFHDRKDNTVNFFRNKERPMFIVECEHLMPNSQTILYGSELGMLLWLAERNSLKVVNSYSTDINKLYTMKLGKQTEGFTTRRLGAYVPAYFPRSQKNYDAPKGQNKKNNRSKRSAVIADMLEELGLHKGERITFWIHGKESYSGMKKATGKVQGTWCENPWSDILIHAVEYEKREEVYKEGIYTGRVLTVGIDSDNQPIIQIAQQTLMTVEAAEEERKEEAVLLKKEIAENATTQEVVDQIEKSDNIEQLYKIQGGAFGSKTLFNLMVQDGCQQCGGNIFPADHEKMTWTREGKAICPLCVNDLQDYGVIAQ